MIEGLLFDISSEELRAHFLKRIDHHKKRAEVYAKQEEELLGEIDEVDPAFSNKRGADSARQQKVGSLKKASDLQFWADHLVPGEIYRLGSTDLAKAELTDERW